MVVMLSVYAMWKVRGRAKSREPFSWHEAFAAIREAGWEIPLPIIILGGIYSGAFALSEAAAITAVYALIVEVGIRREIPITKLPGVMRESMVLVGAIMIILGVSLASTNYLIDTEVPSRLFELVRGKVDSPFVFLILLNLFLLSLGMILDICLLYTSPSPRDS